MRSDSQCRVWGPRGEPDFLCLSEYCGCLLGPLLHLRLTPSRRDVESLYSSVHSVTQSHLVYRRRVRQTTLGPRPIPDGCETRGSAPQTHARRSRLTRETGVACLVPTDRRRAGRPVRAVTRLGVRAVDRARTLRRPCLCRGERRPSTRLKDPVHDSPPEWVTVHRPPAPR